MDSFVCAADCLDIDNVSVTMMYGAFAENTPQRKTSKENEARKQIEIQSVCNWDKDRKKVLEALCRRLSQNNMSRRFFIGPYRIHPVAKICMRKPSGSLITYRVGL